MRHRQKGRHLGRTSSHRKALMRNLASSLFLTERDPDFYEGLFQADGKTPVQPPRFRGRIVTTIHKAKEVKPLVEKCITIARKALPHRDAADEFGCNEDRNSAGWKSWREGEQWQKWNAAMAPYINARRRCLSLLGDKEAVALLFEEVAPRFVDRPGGYTRVMRLAKPRLGDAGVQAILEFVGKNDRVSQKSEKPAFVDTPEDDTPAEEPEVASEETEEVADDAADAEAEGGAADAEATGGEDKA
ncbi:MAG: L17 family ribosomal protein [Planctomycetota bacterium]